MPEFIKKMSRKAKAAAAAVLSAALILSVSLGIFFQSGSDRIAVSNKTGSSLSGTEGISEAEKNDLKVSEKTEAPTKETKASDESDRTAATASSSDVSDNLYENNYDNGTVQSATIAQGNSYVGSSIGTQILTPNENTYKALFSAGYNLTENMLSNLTDDEKEVLFSILNAVENHETQVEVKNGVIKNGDSETLSDMFLLVKIALAKTDMLSPTYVYSGGEYITNLKLSYRLTENQVAAQRAQLKSKVMSIMSSVTEDMDDYDKLLYFHDEIISYCNYNQENENSRSAYGCLVEGKASCEGYSKALLELCDAAGIDCVIAAGSAVTNSQTIKHMWNKVRISGRWYNVDLSWDDADVGSEYDYFLVTDKEISTSHTVEPNKFYDYPSAVFDTDNYFVKNGFFVKSDEEIISSVTKAIESAVGAGRNTASVKFKNKTLFDRSNKLFSDSYMSNPIFEILKSVSKNLGVSIDTSSVYKFVNEDMLTMTFEISYDDETLVG